MAFANRNRCAAPAVSLPGLPVRSCDAPVIVIYSEKDITMNTCAERTHSDHEHRHGPGCGHAAVYHDGHTDYLHDGHLHHPHGDHVDEHVIAVSSENPELTVAADTRPTMSTAPTAVTRRSRTATTSITGSAIISITRMAGIATITAPCAPRDGPEPDRSVFGLDR